MARKNLITFLDTDETDNGLILDDDFEGEFLAHCEVYTGHEVTIIDTSFACGRYIPLFILIALHKIAFTYLLLYDNMLEG